VRRQAGVLLASWDSSVVDRSHINFTCVGWQELEGRVARLKKDRDRLSKDVKALEKTLHGLTQQA
jgi:outer membrane murein-binding lipoprotein Lpp